MVDSYGLNVCVPQNVYGEIPVSKGMGLGGGPREVIMSSGWSLIIGISALVRGPIEIIVEEDIQGQVAKDIFMSC